MKPFLILFFLSSLVSAQTPRELVKLPDSEGELVSPRLTRNPDGTRTVTARFPLPNGNFSYRYEVDPYRGTYKLTPTDTVVTLPPPSLPEPGDGCACEDWGGDCVGSTIVWQGSINPADITRTTLTANWKLYEDYITQTCKWAASGSGFCTVTNAPGGDAWTTQGCPASGTPGGFMQFNKTITGNYYSWKYLVDSLVTNVVDRVTLNINYGVADVDFSHTDTGEGAFWIVGYIGGTTVNTCGGQ